MEPTMPRRCTEPGCDRPHVAKGLCDVHYRQAQKRAMPPVEKTCPKCGTVFIADGTPRKYCSEDCFRGRRLKGRPPRQTDKQCSEPGCERYPNGARGLCRTCYAKARRAGRFGHTECLVEGCTELGTQAKGLCMRHYMEARRTGEIPAMPCSLDGCPEPVAARGLCNMHYMRLMTTGEVGSVERKRKRTGEGSLHPRTGYIDIQINGRMQGQHRWVMEQMLGRQLVEGETVHHINGNRSDNRPQNLELWNGAQPPGQRVEDKVAWAREILSLYGDQFVQPRLLLEDQHKVPPPGG